MARSSLTVRRLASEAHVDIDEVLLVLWEEGMDYLSRPNSIVRRGDATRAQQLVGLATRRELASPKAWQTLFGLDYDGLTQLMVSLGVPAPKSKKLQKKVIHRLKAEANRRGLSWSGATHVDISLNAKEENRKLPVATPPSAPLTWTVIGKERDIRHLSGDDVRAIHQELVEDFVTQADPIEPPGVRDDNLLESAILRPRTSIGGERKYPSVEMHAAALMHSLIHNHPFHNGNKRTAIVSMLALLDVNRLLFTCEEEELFRTVLRIAQHRIVDNAVHSLPDHEVLWIANWLHRNSRWVNLEERNIPFRRLRKLLTQHGCLMDSSKSGQTKITKVVTQRTLFRNRQRTLTSRAFHDIEGREIGRFQVAQIRKDLWLDEPNDVDSSAFYDNAPAAAGEFIIKFRKTLRRLARF